MSVRNKGYNGPRKASSHHDAFGRNKSRCLRFCERQVQELEGVIRENSTRLCIVSQIAVNYTRRIYRDVSRRCGPFRLYIRMHNRDLTL